MKPEEMTCDAQGHLYITPNYFEVRYGRNHRTVRAWIRNGTVRSILEGDALYVHYGDALRLDRVTPRQQRRSLRRRSA